MRCEGVAELCDGTLQPWTFESSLWPLQYVSYRVFFSACKRFDIALVTPSVMCSFSFTTSLFTSIFFLHLKPITLLTSHIELSKHPDPYLHFHYFLSRALFHSLSYFIRFRVSILNMTDAKENKKGSKKEDNGDGSVKGASTDATFMMECLKHLQNPAAV